jgi:hypothetical protein
VTTVAETIIPKIDFEALMYEEESGYPSQR